jgi:hypothetical protein
MRRESADFHLHKAWMVASEAPEARSSHASAILKLWNEWRSASGSPPTAMRRLFKLVVAKDSVSGAPAVLVVNMKVVALAAPRLGMAISMSRRALAALLKVSTNGRYIGLMPHTSPNLSALLGGGVIIAQSPLRMDCSCSGDGSAYVMPFIRHRKPHRRAFPCVIGVLAVFTVASAFLNPACLAVHIAALSPMNCGQFHSRVVLEVRLVPFRVDRIRFINEFEIGSFLCGMSASGPCSSTNSASIALRQAAIAGALTMNVGGLRSECILRTDERTASALCGFATASDFFLGSMCSCMSSSATHWMSTSRCQPAQSTPVFAWWSSLHGVKPNRVAHAVHDFHALLSCALEFGGTLCCTALSTLAHSSPRRAGSGGQTRHCGSP